MRGLGIPTVGAFLGTVLLLATACSQPASSTPIAPTSAPESAKASPTTGKAVEPTKVAASPTAATAAKSAFPQKGKPITLGVPFAAGAPTDVVLRQLASGLEKGLGVPVQSVNKPTASGQVHYSDLSRAATDGYTLGGVSFASVLTIYLDPERKADFTRKSFQPIALQSYQENVLVVGPNSKYKTAKDLVDAAKSGSSIKAAYSGYMGNTHLAWLQFEEIAGVEFDKVNFQDGQAAMTALLGGHVDALITGSSVVTPQVKGGNVIALGVLDKEESRFLPGVKTMEAQGYKVYSGVNVGLVGPAGMPADIVTTLSAATKKAIEDPAQQKAADEIGFNLRYLDAAQFGDWWAQTETDIKPVVEKELKKRNK